MKYGVTKTLNIEDKTKCMRFYRKKNKLYFFRNATESGEIYVGKYILNLESSAKIIIKNLKKENNLKNKYFITTCPGPVSFAKKLLLKAPSSTLRVPIYYSHR